MIRPPHVITVARVQAIEISLNWRWAPVLVLVTWLLSRNVLPARFPTWDVGTSWLVGAAAVLAGEAALLLHELSHAIVARCYGQQVTRIVFHGFLAETIVGDDPPAADHVVQIALVGPAMNIALAGLAEGMRLALASASGRPLDAFLITVIIGNAAAAIMSLLPLGGSDGARALRSWRLLKVPGQRQDENDQNQEAQRRPAVVAPAAPVAVTAAE